MSDSRIDTIKEATVYGLFHDGLLIYIGATTQPLKRRMSNHKANARKGRTPRVYRYIRCHITDLDKELSVRELGYETEQDALNELAHSTLNTEANAAKTSYSGYDWSSEELDVLEEAGSMNEASKLLDVSFNTCRRAAIKLGIADQQGHTEVDWDRWDDFLGTMPDAELAGRIGCTVTNVQRRRWKLGIDAYGCSGRKLTQEEARKVYLLYKTTDVTHAELADAHDVSRSVIGKIVRGDSFPDLDRDRLDAIAERINCMAGDKEAEGIDAVLDAAHVRSPFNPSSN